MSDKKDYIFNIRLSRDTYEKLKQKATENRETMSNLARKVIDDGLEIFQDVSNDLFGNSVSARDKIVHSYKVFLHQDAVCAETGQTMKKGEQAIVGETQTGKKYIFHPSCFEK